MKPHIAYRRKWIILILICVVFSFDAFSQSKIINSGWQFSEDKIVWQTINIPHTWNDKDAFDDISGYRRGLGYYKKQIFISSEEKNKVHYIKFNAVNQEATVLINGRKVGNHKGGYTAFSFDITSYLNYETYNLIEVEVDNSHNLDVPPLDADFTFYGGIYRDVELISVPIQHFSLNDFSSDGFYVHYNDINEEKGNIDVDVVLTNKDKKKSKLNLKIKLLNAKDEIVETFSKTIKLNALSSEKITIDFPEVINPKLWSPENPYLYHLELTISNKDGTILDSKTANVGFRWASADPNKGFFLNGKPIKLIGVNRHQDYQGYGNAVPLKLQEKDIHLIKKMGANVIRFAHYPHRRELYDLCDELGLLVWTEIPVVNLVTNSDAFFNTAQKMQEEHLKQYYNHPSVVMFGYMNEIFLRLQFDKKMAQEERDKLKQDTYRLTEKLEKLTRQIAPNHITVMALHYNEIYNDTKLADIPMLIGWNLYFGWYYETIEDLGKFLDDQHRRYPNRSIMISEYGPGADDRISTQQPVTYDYSQEYQIKLHKSYYEDVQERNFVTGMTAWNFADFGSEFRGESLPHVNQKGLVNYNREPKEIYHWYQSVLLNNVPIVHIANYQKRITLINETAQEISVFSNQKAGKLFLNEEFVKNITFQSGVAKEKLEFTEGINTVKVTTANAEDEASFKVKIIDDLKSKPLKTLAINLGTHINFFDDKSGVTFISDRPYSKNLYGYVENSGKCERKLISNNIKNSHLEAVFQTVLTDCGSYKIDVPNGHYKVKLYFVEPTLKSKEQIIFNLKYDVEGVDDDEQRIFDVYLNDTLLEKQFNMVQAYPEKYGIIKTGIISIKNDEGLTINLKPIEGEPVLSGILVEKLN